MDPSSLQYRLTDEERQTFDQTGLLTIPNALAAEQVEELRTLTDQVYAGKVAAGHDERTALFYPNFIPDSPLFADLVDYPTVLPKVWGILGWNIYLYHAHMIVTPPSGKTRDDATFGWHQDSGRVNMEMEGHPRPRLSLKVAFFLSDISEPGRGNFWVIPGSHLHDTWSDPPMVRDNPKAPCRCWRSPALPCCSTAACGTRPAQTGPTSRAKCFSMATVTAGFVPRTI